MVLWCIYYHKCSELSLAFTKNCITGKKLQASLCYECHLKNYREKVELNIDFFLKWAVGQLLMMDGKIVDINFFSSISKWNIIYQYSRCFLDWNK